MIFKNPFSSLTLWCHLHSWPPCYSPQFQIIDKQIRKHQSSFRYLRSPYTSLLWCPSSYPCSPLVHYFPICEKNHRNTLNIPSMKCLLNHSCTHHWQWRLRNSIADSPKAFLGLLHALAFIFKERKKINRLGRLHLNYATNPRVGLGNI